MTIDALAPHLIGPAQKPQELTLLIPQEAQHLPRAYLVCMHTAVGLNAPAKVRAAPRPQTRTARAVPKKAESANHPSSLQVVEQAALLDRSNRTQQRRTLSGHRRQFRGQRRRIGRQKRALLRLQIRHLLHHIVTLAGKTVLRRV